MFRQQKISLDPIAKKLTMDDDKLATEEERRALEVSSFCRQAQHLKKCWHLQICSTTNLPLPISKAPVLFRIAADRLANFPQTI